MKNFLGDMITRIKNGQKAKLKYIEINSYSPKYCLFSLKLLRDEGFIYGYSINFVNNKPLIKVYLKYTNTGLPVIKNIFQVSKPGCRIYLSTKSLWKPKATTGLFVISTPKGLVTDRDARFYNLGGEVLFGIY